MDQAPEQARVTYIRLAALETALKLETSHPGFKANARVSTLQSARALGFTGRTKAAALEYVTQLKNTARDTLVKFEQLD